jgi:hypothetical protein
MTSQVGTSTSVSAKAYSHMRKCFFAVTRFWDWYSDGTDLGYKTSLDGSSWSSFVSVRSCGSGGLFSVWFDGTYVHYVYHSANYGDPVYYRRGTVNSDGSITWSAVEQTAMSGIGGVKYYYVCISVDTSGYAWIGLNRRDTQYPMVTKNANNDGTWSTDSGFPYVLKTTADYWSVIPVPLTGAKVYVVYGEQTHLIYGKLYNAGWGSEEQASTSTVPNLAYVSVVNDQDDVQLVFLNTGLSIIHIKRTYTTSVWSSEQTVQASVTSSSAPVLSISSATGNLYCYWAGSPTANHIYYKLCTSGVWDVDPTDWITETSPPLTSNDFLTCYYKVYGVYTGLEYMTVASDPYIIKFAYIAAMVYHISGVTRDSDGTPLGSCMVDLFRSSNKSFVAEVVSGLDGSYSFTVSDNTTQYFVRAYKDGTPDVFGVTDRYLVGV